MGEDARGAAPDGWWTELYDRLLADVLLEREQAPNAVLDFLERALGVAPGARLFDQCCGIGSLAVPLAARGYEVVGCDLGDGYVERGRAAAAAAGVRVELHHADAFAFVPEAPCAGAFNWWTGFGYARDDARNLEMLRRAAEALVPGGRLVLDTMNVPGVLRDFRPTVHTVRGGVQLTRESALDVDAGLLHKRWIYTRDDGHRVERRSTMRLHTPWELRALLHAAGFTHVRMVGDVDEQPLTIDSPRCIAIATREGA